MTQLIIYIVLAIAILVIFNSILGKPVGKMPEKPSTQKKDVYHEKQDTFMKGPASESLMKLSEKDPSFNPASFLKGAEKAYNWIVSSYLTGDTKKLKNLVTQEIFNLYREEIQKRGKESSVKVESIDLLSTDIERAEIENDFAYISVRYKAILKTREDSEDKLSIEDTEEVWKFKKEISNKNPNWILTAVSHDF